MALVSVIVTCYNLGAYLLEALESALGQTYADVEVVLVDDGSTDPATIAVLDVLPPHPRLRVIRTANQGVSRARNYGIDQSTGEYILCLDADDRILPTYLEQAIAILDTRPEVGFVGCHYRIFGERTGECRPAAYQIPDLLVENVVPIASVYRRVCWQESGGYCAELNSIEDWDMWIGILERSYTGIVLPEILFEYRVRPNSNLSHIRDPHVYEGRMRLLYQRHELFYNQYTFDILALKDRQFAQMHSYAMWLEQQAKNWEREAQNQHKLVDQLQKEPAGIWRWFTRQNNRWQRIRADHPTFKTQMKVVARKSLVRIRQRIIALFGN